MTTTNRPPDTKPCPMCGWTMRLKTERYRMIREAGHTFEPPGDVWRGYECSNPACERTERA